MDGPSTRWRFDRQELAGSLGDLGTLLPIAIGLILINGLDATAVFVTVGLYYVLSGLYFRLTVPVQPMKVIGAYAITGMLTPLEITSAGFLLGILLLVLAFSGAISVVARFVPVPVVRGVQLSTGMLLLCEGIRLMLGRSAIQQAQGAGEPFLSVAAIGPVPIGIVLGVAAVLTILLLIENRTAPAALVVVVGGAIAGLALGGYRSLVEIVPGIHLPGFLPFGTPGLSVVTFALLALVLPQVPMTLGNAIFAQEDLTRRYFGEAAARRSSFRALAASMGLANIACALVGGMPLCHGSGGLAAHYRFGARTPGSNLMIGGLFLAVGVVFGEQASALVTVLPLAILGSLLVFAGGELALTILDLKQRRDLFVAISMLGVALTTNLAIAFGVGLALAIAFRHPKLSV